MSENFSNLQKGEYVYILDIKTLDIKKSVVVESDDSGIYTQFKDFLKDKFGSKLNKMYIKDGDLYCSVSIVDIEEKLEFIKCECEGLLQDYKSAQKYLESHKEQVEQQDIANTNKTVDKLNDKINKVQTEINKCKNGDF